jgi:hypothetical protein
MPPGNGLFWLAVGYSPRAPDGGIIRSGEVKYVKEYICDKPPDVFQKEWARRDLRGAAASAVRRLRSCSINQIIGMEKRSRTYGLSSEETVAAIYEGMNGVANPEPKKLAALRKQFPR